jgi:osmotically-inducible protein OsmY
MSVRRGQVTLSGEVSLRSQKQLAERTVESLYGVREVRDNLRVAGR